MQISDPRLIPVQDLPLFVFSDNATDLIAFLITWRTKGIWNHSMLAHRPGLFAVQGLTYKENPMSNYLKKGCRMDFYELVNMDSFINTKIYEYISNRLRMPWYKKIYDWVGIFGQAIGLPKIHTPGLEYCSVDVTNCLKSVAQFLPELDKSVILAIPNEVNPQELHDIMVSNPKVFKEYGYYESDEGIVI